MYTVQCILYKQLLYRNA